MTQRHSLDGAPATTQGSEQARVEDIGIARAVVRAARAVSGVSDINPGRFAIVATHGRRERVPGVAVSRTEDGALCIEVHVSLDARVVMAPSPAPSELAAGSGRPDTHVEPRLLLLAGQIRHAIDNAIHALGLPGPARIDVVMDDMV